MKLFEHPPRDQKLLARKQNYELRRKFSDYINNLAIGWVVFIGMIACFCGCFFWKMLLYQPFLIVLIIWTSINIIGLMWFSANKLFPNRRRKKKRR